MKRETLLTKVIAMLLCAMMVVSYLPAAVLANDWEGPIDEVPPTPGSEEAPIALTALENTVTVPAGEAIYYSSRHDGMIMTVTGTTGYAILVGDESTADTEGTVTMDVVCASTTEPFIFAVENNTDADVEYTISFAFPEGHPENPKAATLYEQTVSVEAGDTDGYYLKYVADYTGKLQITISAESGWAYSVNNLTAYTYGETQWSDSDPVVNPYTLDVTAGDEIEIMVNTYNPEDQWNSPAGDITVDIQYVTGSCPEYPIFLGEMENTVTNAGTVYYQGYFSGTTMTVAGEGEFSVVYNGETIAAVDGVVSIPVSTANPRMPVEFSIIGDGEYTISFAFPVGSANNPLVATLGDNTASVEANNNQGFLMTYTAEYTGVLLVEISGVDDWTYNVNNLTTYVYGDTQWSDSDPVVNPAEVAVTAGDEIQIIVNTYNPADMWSTPAGEINVNLSYKLGSCPEYAIFLGEMENTVTNAGTVYYMGYFSGTTMTVAGEGEFSVVYNGETIAAVDGVVSIPVSTPNPRMPVEFSVIGDGEFSINFAYPVGSQANPAVAVLGDNVASIEAGSQGYYYTYTAPEAGDLDVTIVAEAGWTYVINNMTTGIYGDTQWSDSDPVVNPATITVAAGDELQIIVNTYDPASYEAPAGSITMNLAYAVEEECEHEYEAEITYATTTAGGYTTYTCSKCGESYQDNFTNPLPRNLRFASAYLSLESDLSVTFQVRSEVLADYENVRLVFTLGDTGHVVEMTEEEYFNGQSGRPSFKFTGVAPRHVNTTIYATLYGTIEGVEHTYTMEYSAAKYCYTTLRAASTAAKLKTLIVDLLSYGAAHQVYGKTNLENLATNDLTDAEKALGTSTVPAMTSYMSVKYVTHEAPTARFNNAALYLEDAVTIRCKLTLNDGVDINNVTVQVTDDDGNEWIVLGEELTHDSGNVYYLNFKALSAQQMRKIVYITICENGAAISHTLRYSIESYAATGYPSAAGTALGDVILAMIRYGDSAKAYFENK